MADAPVRSTTVLTVTGPRDGADRKCVVNDLGGRAGSLTAAVMARRITAARKPPFGPRITHHG